MGTCIKNNTMFKYILANGHESVNWMAIFALITFVSIFVISAIAIFVKSNAHISHMESLPLDDELEQ